MVSRDVATGQDDGPALRLFRVVCDEGPDGGPEDSRVVEARSMVEAIILWRKEMVREMVDEGLLSPGENPGDPTFCELLTTERLICVRRQRRG